MEQEIDREIMDWIGDVVRTVYEPELEKPMPDALSDLCEMLDEPHTQPQPGSR